MNPHATTIHTLFALCLLPGIVACGAGEPAKGTRFSDSPGPTDDDDTEEPDPMARAAWIEMDRAGTFGQAQAQLAIHASFFAPRPVVARTPLPGDLDACDAGVDLPGLFGVPPSAWDAGTPVLALQDGSEVDLGWDGPDSRWEASLPASAWIGEQDYGIGIGGGQDIAALDLPALLGTPATLAVSSIDTAAVDGLALTWAGSNDNGHVELRLTSDPFPGDDGQDLVAWVACRLLDDGGQVVPWDDLAVVSLAEVQFELLRARSTVFLTAEGYVGVAAGASTVDHRVVIPGIGDDDDSAAER